VSTELSMMSQMLAEEMQEREEEKTRMGADLSACRQQLQVAQAAIVPLLQQQQHIGSRP